MSKPRFSKSSTPSVQPYPGPSDTSLSANHAGKLFKKSSYCGGEMKNLGAEGVHAKAQDSPALQRMRLFVSNKSHGGRPIETRED